MEGRRALTRAFVAVLLYYAAGRLGLTLASLSIASPAWPPAGIGIGLLIIWGLRYWPALLVAGLAFEWTATSSPTSALLLATAGTVEALVAAAVTRRLLGGRNVLDQLPTTLLFVAVVAGVAAPLSATIGTTTLVLLEGLPGSAAAGVGVTWWLGDVGGALVVAPVIFLADRLRAAGIPSVRVLFFHALLTVVAAAVFLAPAEGPWAFLLLLLLVPLAVHRRTPGEAAVGALLVGIVGVTGTTLGRGPFAGPDPNEALLLSQIFLAFLSLTILVLSAGIGPRREDAEEQRARRIAAALVLAPLLLSALLLSTVVEAQNEATSQTRRDADADRVLNLWVDLIERHEQELHNLRAFFLSSETVERDEFATYVRSSDWLRELGGVQAVEFIRLVPAVEVPAYEDAVRNDTSLSEDLRTGFVVFPSVTDPSAVVELVYPLRGNEPVVGLNALSEPVRTRAIHGTLATGEPSASAPVRLVQETGESQGLLVFLAVPDDGPDAIGATGLVASVHRVEDMVVQVLPRIPDGTSYHLVDTTDGAPGVFVTDTDPGASLEGASVRTLDVHDREWTLSIRHPGDLLTPAESGGAWASLAGGGILSVGIAGVVYAYDTTRRRAVALAERMTAEAQAAEEGRRALERRQALQNYRNRFINNAAHELKTPLTPVLMQISILRRHVPEEAHRNLEVLQRNLERLRGVVDRLLLAANAAGHAIAPAREETDLVALANSVVEAYRPSTQDQGLELEGPEGELRLAVDASMVRQVVEALVDNAVRATDAGRITVRVTAEDDGARVEVQDTGCGIDDDSGATLFEMFSQTDKVPSEEVSGSGMGLFTARAMVEAHGGTIGYHSDGAGRGSTFWFTLLPPYDS